MGTYWGSTGISQRFINKLQRYCAKNNQIEKIVLFGSRARGDYHRSSDIDLAGFIINSSHTQQNLMEQSIYKLPTPLQIDVVFMNRLSKEKMIVNILKEGVVIYEQGKAVREA